MKSEVDCWSTNDADEHLTHEDIGEAVYEWWDQGGEEDEVTVYGYKRREFPPEEDTSRYVLDLVLEWLDENHELGNPDAASEPTKRMEEAARVFAREIADEYHVWACELVETKRVKVADYLSSEDLSQDKVD